MATDSPYGGTLPPATTTTTVEVAVPKAPPTEHELAFTGSDLVLRALLLALIFVVAGLIIRWVGRPIGS